MANRSIQNYLSSGEATEIRLGGPGTEKKVVTQEDIAYIPVQAAYCSYASSTALSLTTTFQKVTTFNPIIPPLNVSYAGGTFTVLTGGDGIYSFNLERIYLNMDTNPTSPVNVYIQMKMNGTIVFSRDMVIGAATANDEPTTLPLNTNRIIEVSVGDQFEFEVRAQESLGGTPSDVDLAWMEVTAHKVYNKVA